MAFRYTGKDIATALGQAVIDKQARSEAPVTFGYDRGTPTRYAGEAIARGLGIDGEFGAMANNKQDKNGQKYLEMFARQWADGPFGPDINASEGVA